MVTEGSMITVVIPTIRQHTVACAIRSARAVGLPVIVVGDGVKIDVEPQEGVEVITLGHNYGRLNGLFYGNIACTVGVLMAKTEFAWLLGDDDELTPDAGDIARAAIARDPKTDIWIPGISYNDGHTLCMSGEAAMRPGNVSHPILRYSVVARVPLHNDPHAECGHSDFDHLDKCHRAGFSLDWLGSVCVNIRPKLPGKRGYGTG